MGERRVGDELNEGGDDVTLWEREGWVMTDELDIWIRKLMGARREER